MSVHVDVDCENALVAGGFHSSPEDPSVSRCLLINALSLLYYHNVYLTQQIFQSDRSWLRLGLQVGIRVVDSGVGVKLRQIWTF